MNRNIARLILIAAAIGLILPVPADAINRGSTLKGTVTGLHGEPIVDADVILQERNGRRKIGEDLTDEEGEFEIWDCPNGMFELVVEKKGFSKTSRLIRLSGKVDVIDREDIQLLGHGQGPEKVKLYLPEGQEPSAKARRLWDKSQAARAVGDYGAAMKNLEKAIAKDPTFSRAHTDLGVEHERAGDRDKAAEFYREGIRLNSGDPLPRVNLASVLLKNRQPEPALEQLQEAIKLEPNFPEAHLYTGQALTALKRFPEAVPALEKALALDPEACSSAYGYLGNCYIKAGDLQKARAAFQKFVDAHPDSPQSVRLKGTIQKLDEGLAAAAAP